MVCSVRTNRNANAYSVTFTQGGTISSLGMVCIILADYHGRTIVYTITDINR